jgi:uncharacterized protein YjiS (DUF1127 family)
MAHAISYFDYADHAAQPGILARLQQALADHRAYRAIRDELDAMRDRDLADIGLSQLNVRDTARAAVYDN